MIWLYMYAKKVWEWQIVDMPKGNDVSIMSVVDVHVQV